jgi:hypothetical protein
MQAQQTLEIASPAKQQAASCGVEGSNRGHAASALAFWESAQSYFASGEFAGAIRCLERFRPANGDSKSEAAYLHLRGASRLMLGQVNLARNDLERAIQLDSSIRGYYLDLALACLKSGDRSRAEKIAASAVQHFPDDIKLRVQMASLTDPVHAVSADWRLQGTGVIGCPCHVPCPCRSNAAPTGAHCEALGVMQIESGYWGKTPLKNLRFAIPGCMSNPFRLLPVLYVDSGSSESEQEALKQILLDFNDQHSVSFVKTKRVPISFLKRGDLVDTGSPGLFQLRVKFPPSSGSEAVSTAALDYFSNTIQYVQNLSYWFKDPELGSAAAWDYSGKQANYRVISISSDDYRRKQMLIQWADESGGFNAQQLRLIRELHLPAPGQRF